MRALEGIAAFFFLKNKQKQQTAEEPTPHLLPMYHGHASHLNCDWMPSMGDRRSRCASMQSSNLERMSTTDPEESLPLRPALGKRKNVSGNRPRGEDSRSRFDTIRQHRGKEIMHIRPRLSTPSKCYGPVSLLFIMLGGYTGSLRNEHSQLCLR